MGVAWVHLPLRRIGVAATLAALGLGAATASAAPLKVSVSYRYRQCGDAPARQVRLAPVTAGTIELDRPGNGAPVRVSLAGAGPVRAALDGDGPVRARLVLQTSLVRVVDGATGSAAQRIALGTAVVRNGKVSFVLPRSERDDGHVNTLLELQRGARFAARTAPVRLPQVIANVVDGPVAARPGTAFDEPRRIVVGKGSSGFGGTGDTDAQWEPAVLLHEYGHLVLHHVARDGSPGGDHDWSRAYPENPNLAWSEGFASAFAALARPDWGGRLYLDCGRPAANYEELPARPGLASARDVRYAQWNETRVAGATYQVVKRLGGGERGLRRLLTALRSYRRDGHPVWTARDLRDLVVTHFERTPGDHVRFEQVFRSEGIHWSLQIAVGVGQSGVEGMRSADAELVISVVGPGGFSCMLRGDDVNDLNATPLNGGGFALGERSASGGLSFLDDDDCFLVSGDGTVGGDEAPHGMGGDRAEVPFPFLAGGGHFGGRYEVRARYVCAFDVRFGPQEQFFCPPVATFRVGVTDPLLIAAVPELATPSDVPLALNVDTVVGTYTAEGRCTVGQVDCST